MVRRHKFSTDDPSTLAGRVSIVCRKCWDGSVTKMAADLGVTLSALCTVINGKRAAGRKMLTAIVEHSPVNATWLLTGSGDPLLTQPPVPVTDHSQDMTATSDQTDMQTDLQDLGRDGVPADFLTQSQTGEPMTQWLTTFAGQHGISRDEAATRLLTLCRFEFGVCHYDSMAELAEVVRGDTGLDSGFHEASRLVSETLQSQGHGRGGKLMKNEWRESIMDAIRFQIHLRRLERAEIEAQERVQVQIHRTGE